MLLSIENIKISYGTHNVIKGITLTVKSAEIVALLGVNGSGKTTLFHAIAGLIMQDSGKIFLNGKDISLLPIHKRAAYGMGFLPQESSIFNTLSVRDNILAVLEIKEPARKKRFAILNAVLKDMRLEAIANKMGETLSGGERRRVEIARAIALKPKIILLDEPFANIDPITIQELKALFLTLKEKGLALFIIDHNAKDICSFVDNIYLIHEGKLHVEGSPDIIIHDKNAQNSYFGYNF